MDLTNKLPKVQGSYRFNVDLSKTTWFQVGGKADVLFRPKDIEDLSFFLKNKEPDLKVTIIGVGSNLIIREGGVEGVVVKLGKEFTNISHENDVLTAGAGALCANVALYSKLNALTNLEFLTGIPGSIGGAIAMNAGCYDGDVSQSLISAKVMNFSGEVMEIANEDFGFSYRSNKLARELFILEGKFKVAKSTSEEVSTKIASFNKKREESQPIRSKTGGSTFKNPAKTSTQNVDGKKAWQLIDESGARGMKVGDAQMSEKHCNFMINNGNAKSQDLIDLGNKVIDLVKEKTGVTLEWEIKIIGKK
jgi:UDP-N-acetylmuramate dehydrogenase